MGYMKHHSISVSSSIELSSVHEKAIEIFGDLVSPIIESKLNGYKSFFIAPDGSKEYWPDSELYDNKRNILIEYIEGLKYEDGSNSVRYCEYVWGEDNHKSFIERHN